MRSFHHRRGSPVDLGIAHPITLSCHCGSARAILRHPPHHRVDVELIENTKTYEHESGKTLHFCPVCGARLLLTVHRHSPRPLVGCIEDPEDVEEGVWDIGITRETGSLVETDKLQGSCLCGAVLFSVRAPRAEDHVDGWVKEGKFATGLCFCRSCRTTTGAPYWNWAFVPKVLISVPRSSTACLEEYRSSENAVRRFCGICGETVFYKNDVMGKGVLWDVAMQTLHIPEGASERDWFIGLYDGKGEALDIDRYIEGWMEGRPSFESEGWEFLGRDKVDNIAREWREKWASSR
ncbi:Mss4-like protein [Sphaerosporella brunnea]|uniref:Mss4-like protein n=1 Tax=Sphaerosporella brunnea TaxID=1250544 RepID=A0A5J5EEQ9_9PEZI|nr:Mss4-like protein [Sphaerosporella brunnea]